MPKALFFNVPAHGHVNPSLALVAQLVRRGHQITYFLTPGFGAAVKWQARSCSHMPPCKTIISAALDLTAAGRSKRPPG